MAKKAKEPQEIKEKAKSANPGRHEAQTPEPDVESDAAQNSLEGEDEDADAPCPWETLKRQPTVRIMVPCSDKAFWEGFLNGHAIMIKTNEYVDVPQDVAKLIENNAKVLRESDAKLNAFQSRAGVKIAEIG